MVEFLIMLSIVWLVMVNIGFNFLDCRLHEDFDVDLFITQHSKYRTQILTIAKNA